MRRWLLAFLALLLAGGTGVATQTTLLALPPITIEEAVAATLLRAGAPTAGLRIENVACIPDHSVCMRYIADVRLADEHVIGRLSCEAAWRDCALTMAEYGLRAVSVPELGRPHPLTMTLRNMAQRAFNWALALVGR